MKQVAIKKKYLYGGASFVVVGLAVAVFLSRKLIYESFDYKTVFYLSTLQPGFRKKVRKLMAEAKRKGMDLRVISALRDCEEQDRLYSQGRTTGGKIVTNARCGQSAHNYGLAVDVVEFVNGQPRWENPRWEEIGRMGERAGMHWGGRWKSRPDRPHFQGVDNRAIAGMYQRFLDTGELNA